MPRAPVLPLLLTAGLTLIAACDLFRPMSEGEKLWRKDCADCHGIDGAGNTPRYMGQEYADLRDDAWRTGGDRETIENVIREGVFGSMPAHDELTPQQMKALIDYLYKLRGESG